MSANEVGPESLLGSVAGIDGAAGCVKTHMETLRTHDTRSLICKLSGEVGQYVTNKRDSHIHALAGTLRSGNRSAAPQGVCSDAPNTHHARGEM